MSLISEQIKRLRLWAKGVEEDNFPCDESPVSKMLLEAADTIEVLSAKLRAANMECSSAYYNGEDNMNDTMIRASMNANRTKYDVIDTYNKKGLGGVYNLGQKDMYEYLTKQ